MVLKVELILKFKFLTGSNVALTLVRLIFDNFVLSPLVNREVVAKLLSSTSLAVVRLTPNCSISLLVPKDKINRFLGATIHLPSSPYLNLLSPKP